MAIVSEGPVASVAMFTTKPLHEIRSVAADTSSRTSNALLRVLCYERFGIDPEFIPMAPRPAEMLRRCDAALVIGDAALFFDHAARGRREDRPGRAVDEDERAAVRLGVLGRPAGSADARADRTQLAQAQGCRRGGVRRDRGGLLRTRAGRGGQALSEGEYPLRLGRRASSKACAPSTSWRASTASSSAVRRRVFYSR